MSLNFKISFAFSDVDILMTGGLEIDLSSKFEWTLQ